MIIVGMLRHLGNQRAKENSRNVGLDRLKRAANTSRRFRFQIPKIRLRWSTTQEDRKTAFGRRFMRQNRSPGNTLRLQTLRQTQTKSTAGRHPQPLSTRTQSRTTASGKQVQLQHPRCGDIHGHHERNHPTPPIVYCGPQAERKHNHSLRTVPANARLTMTAYNSQVAFRPGIFTSPPTYDRMKVCWRSNFGT